MRRSEVFVDSNVWIYAFLESQSDLDKRRIALKFLEDTSRKSEIVVSVQVLNEFHWLLSRKYQVAEADIRSKVFDGIMKLADVMPLQRSTYEKANILRDAYNLSFWDSLIVAAARERGCSHLYSEDMQAGLVIEKGLRISSPFEGDVSPLRRGK